MQRQLTSKDIFTVFTESNVFTSNILEAVFTFRLNGKVKKFENNILNAIDKFNENSKEFCKEFKDGVLKIKSIDGFQKGYSARDLGSLRYGNYKVYALDVSRLNSKMEPIYTDIIIKKNNNKGFSRRILNFDDTKRYKNTSGVIVDIGDPYNEIFINTYLNIAYDSGNFLHIPKFYGGYWCGKESYMMSEKLSVTVLDILDYNSKYFIKKWANPKEIDNILINILFQVIYAISYLKNCFGIRHFDMHLKNVMCKYVKDTFNTKENIDTVYQCKNLKNINYFTYNIRDKNIMIENTGLIAKIIDFGQSGVIVDKLEVLDNGYNMFHSGLDAKNQTDNVSEFFTMEYVFFLINMFKKYVENIGFKSIFLDCIIYLLKDLKDSENDELITNNILNNILEVENVIIDNNINIINHNEKVVFKHTYSHTGYTVEYPDNNVNIKRINGTEYKIYSWFMNRRNTGVKGVKKPQNYFLNRFLSFLKHIGQSSDSLYWITNNSKPPLLTKLDSKNSIVFNYDIEKGVDNELIKYYNRFSYYSDMCNENTLKQDINYDIIFDNIISENDGTYDSIIKLATNAQKCMLYKNQVVDRYSLSNYYKQHLFTKKSKYNKLLNDTIDYKFLELNPGTSEDDYLKFKKQQRWVDYKYVDKSLIGTPIWSVRIHMLKIKKSINIRFNLNKSLWQAASNTSSDGLFINGGYFIVNKNLKNKLGLKVGFSHPPTKNDIYKPIGYYMDEDGAETVLNVPHGYENSYGAIIVKNNKIKLMKYNDFLNKHELEKSKQFIQLKNDNIITIESSIIKTINNKPVIKNDKFKYDMAFVSGPILIWNNNIVFNDKTLNEEFKYKNKEYKVVKQAKSNNKFTAIEDEKDFPYGQRHSNTYMNHNIIAEDKNGNIIFFLVEGRGYYSPGLVKTQIAKILHNIGMKNAISLDGGFSAQAIVKEKGNKKYLINDPEKRNIGLSLAFTIN